MIANKIYRGSTEISKAYLNGQIVYSSEVAEPFTATYQIDDILEPLTLPVTKDYPIDWGDGVTTTTGNSHFYTSTGVKTVKMFGVVDDFRFNNSGDRLKLLSVENWGGFKFIINSIFYGCGNLSALPIITEDRPFLNNSSLQFLRTSLGSSFIDLGGSVLDFNDCINIFASFPRVYATSELRIINTQNIESWAFAFQRAAELFIFNCDLSLCDWSSATSIQGIMQDGKAEFFSYQYLDNLYNKWASGAASGGLDFTKLINLTTNFGTIQYSSVGAAARASLVSQGLIITDGGNNGL